MSNKMDQTKIAQVLADSASTLVKVAHERDALKTERDKLAQENAALKNRMEAEKVAMDMHERGINAEVAISDLVEALEKKAAEDPAHFQVLKEAVGLTGPDMFKSASIGGKTEASGGGITDFERFIHGDVS
jgi:predicted RNase H-like nuclease (RuvC/YqgF family)